MRTCLFLFLNDNNDNKINNLWKVLLTAVDLVVVYNYFDSRNSCSESSAGPVRLAKYTTKQIFVYSFVLQQQDDIVQLR